MNEEINETAARICDSAQTFEKVSSLARIVAEMIVRTHWDACAFGFEAKPWGVVFHCGNSEQNLSGYNFGYQVNLVCNVIEKAGLYE